MNEKQTLAPLKEAQNWYTVRQSENLITPSLLVYPDRIEKNIQQMIKIAREVHLLRPHVKTHKMAEIIQMQLDHGIHKFKCATIAEAELLARTGAQDILLAVQPTGINIQRFFTLMETYPNSDFSAIVDNLQILEQLQTMASQKNRKVSLWMDINNGMNRTGIAPGEGAIALYKAMETSEHLTAKGFHVYDGHFRQSDPSLRKAACDEAFDQVLQLKDTLEKQGFSVPNIVAGGSPTFGIHSERKGIEKSPGTTLLWDEGYGRLFPELGFLPAAVLMTRIISKPTPHHICFDLGHKSIAPEMPLPRVVFLDKEATEQVGQSEEHLVVKCQDSEAYTIGSVHYAIPIHICPTVAKHEQVLTVNQGEISGSWKVAARNYTIGI